MHIYHGVIISDAEQTILVEAYKTYGHSQKNYGRLLGYYLYQNSNVDGWKCMGCSSKCGQQYAVPLKTSTLTICIILNTSETFVYGGVINALTCFMEISIFWTNSDQSFYTKCFKNIKWPAKTKITLNGHQMALNIHQVMLWVISLMDIHNSLWTFTFLKNDAVDDPEAKFNPTYVQYSSMGCRRFDRL